MNAANALTSLLLAALQRALDARDFGALAVFWHQVAERGTPLVEPIPGDAEHMLVIFLWRATEPVENVVVFIPLVHSLGWDFADSQMDHRPGTDPRVQYQHSL